MTLSGAVFPLEVTFLFLSFQRKLRHFQYKEVANFVA